MLLKFLLPSSLLKGVLGKSFLPKGDSLRQSVDLMPVYPPVCVCVCVCWDEGRYQGGKSHGLDNDSNQTRSRFL